MHVIWSLTKIQSVIPRIHPPHKNVRGRIIGGDEATPHAYPYQVGLSINEGMSLCGGSLISSNYVLTAAHCAIVISTVEVILGAHNVTENETTQIRLQGKEIKIHDQYDARLHRNDIALIKLNFSVPLTFAIQPVKIPSASQAEKTYDDLFSVATGWGLVEDKSLPTINDMSDTLQVLSVPIMNVDICGEYYNDDEATYITTSNLCTSGYKNKGTCKGDSGGPLVYDGTLIGISSIGSTRCEECYPSIYTRVGAYLDWIKNNSDVIIEF
ncbi:brachyurin-like isoform X2 [Harmonia axyridis]|uniref:brachyurin-like isoform X2 n=1 Tax=Harmonia axyridis TaxID=115357 RepID=UPI001E278C28|nr:brachyurin-like isoform X2 [Harmonia axyridis]